MAGTRHADRSITACVFAGRMRGRFSVMPPPVMCAIPLIVPDGSSGRITGRYVRCGVSSASPIDVVEPGKRDRTSSPATSNAIRRASEYPLVCNPDDGNPIRTSPGWIRLPFISCARETMPGVTRAQAQAKVASYQSKLAELLGPNGPKAPGEPPLASYASAR